MHDFAMRTVKAILFALVICCVAQTYAQQRKKATDFKITNGRLELPGTIAFGTGGATLTADSETALWHVVDFLQSRDDITRIRIEGHTDTDGDAAANQTLTEQRALATAKWLVAHDIDCKRLVAVGFGGTKPVEDNRTPAGKAANRRIEIRLAELRGRLIGGDPADGGGKAAGDPCKK